MVLTSLSRAEAPSILGRPEKGPGHFRIDIVTAELMIYGFGWSRDNKLLAYTLGTEIRDVVLVSSNN
jgi:hypothetical protein